MIKKINPKHLYFNKKIQELCKLRYPQHPKGCPNYGKKEGCPPNVPLIDNILDLGKPVYVIWTDFKVGEHAQRMWKKHPDWTLGKHTVFCTGNPKQEKCIEKK